MEIASCNSIYDTNLYKPTYYSINSGYRTHNDTEGYQNINGAFPANQICKAQSHRLSTHHNPSEPTAGVYAIARYHLISFNILNLTVLFICYRCCDFSSYSVSCGSDQGWPSGPDDDDESYTTCGSNQYLTGWYVSQCFCI